jgi:hypothetical protein
VCKPSHNVDGYAMGMSVFCIYSDTACGVIMFELYTGTLFHAAWAGRMGIQYGQAVWAGSMGRQYGQAVWAGSMGRQYGQAVWAVFSLSFFNIYGHH